MQNRVEIWISGNTSATTMVGGMLDLFGNEEINIVYSVKDYRDVTSTNSSYSQTFQIPGTKNNNILFQNLFLIGADGKFDPRKKASCSIYVDSQTVIDGTIQIVSIDVADRDNPVYSMTVYGQTKSFNSSIKGKYLTDYDWSELNHILSIDNIQNTWSGSSSLGYYYSFKDYGYDYSLDNIKTTTAKAGIPIGNWFPDIYNKYIIDKIFSGAGYTYSSNLFSSTTFNQTVIPYNRDPVTIMGSDYVTARTFDARNTTVSAITFSMMTINTSQVQPYYYEFFYPIRANVIFSGSSASTLYNQNATGDSYTFDQNMISQFSFSVNTIWTNSTGAMRAQVGAQFFRSDYYGGTIPFYEDLSMTETAGVNSFNIFTTPVCDNVTVPWSASIHPYRPFRAGEKVWAKLHLVVNNGYVAAPGASVPFQVTGSCITWKHIPSAQRTAGQTVNMNNVIPEKILVTDYLKSIFNMFNCYIEPSKTVPNQLVIESFEDYYALGTTHDWSTKLDRSVKATETLISEELAKKYTFTYKEDKDFLNQNYKDTVKRVYGDWYYDTENDFTTSESAVELIFSPTPVDNIIKSNEFIVPKIGKYDSNNKFGKTNFNIRFLRKNPTLKRLPSGQVWGFTGATNYTSYPYAGHLDDPFTGTTDYNFGSVPFVYYPWSLSNNVTFTENNLVNTYWKKYLDEITDKEAKAIKVMVKLTPADIAQFKFQDRVYIDGITSEGGHTYRVNSITFPTNGKPSTVELLKVKSGYFSKFASRRLLTGLSTGNGNNNIGLNVGNAQMVMPGGSIGNGTFNSSNGTFSVGDNNSIASYSDGAIVVGSRNIMLAANTGTTVLGTENYINENAGGSTIIGDSNTGATGSTTYFIEGSGNFIATTERVKITGNNNLINVSGGTNAVTTDVHIIGSNNIGYGKSTGVTVNGDSNIINEYNLSTDVFGDSNTVGYATGSTIDGSNNTIISLKNSTIRGSLNQVDAENAVIYGNNNNASYGYITGVTIFGNTNIIQSQFGDGFIVGANNLIQGVGSGHTIIGNNNVVGNNSSNSFIFGDNNDAGAFINHEGSVTFGSGNSMNAPNSLIVGKNNASLGGKNVFIKGNGNIISYLDSPTIAGDNNNAYFSSLCNINGNGNTIGFSTATTVFGVDNIIMSASSSQIIGSGNSVSYSDRAIVQGDNNYVYTGATNVKVYGKNNIVHSAATGVHIVGDNNIVESGVTNVSIMSINGITATLSDTVHTQNVFVYNTLSMQNTSNARQAGGVASQASAAFGSGGTSSGDYSFSVNYNNTASGQSSFASGEYSFAIGRASSTFGKNTRASGVTSIAMGEDSTAQKDYSIAGGNGAEATRYAEFARSSAGNYGQYGSVMFAGLTASATTSELFLSTLTSERFTLAIEESYFIKVKAVGVDYSFMSSGYSACFEGSILIKNSAGTIEIVNGITSQVYADSIVSTSTLTLSGDNTNKSLMVLAGGPVGTPSMIWTVQADYVKCMHNPI